MHQDSQTLHQRIIRNELPQQLLQAVHLLQRLNKKLLEEAKLQSEAKSMQRTREMPKGR